METRAKRHRNRNNFITETSKEEDEGPKMAAKRSRTFENLEPQILENLKPLEEPPIITRRRKADIGRRGQIFQEKQRIIENLKDL